MINQWTISNPGTNNLIQQQEIWLKYDLSNQIDGDNSWGQQHYEVINARWSKQGSG